MYRNDYLEVFLALFRRYEWMHFFWQGNSGEETVSKRIGVVSKEIQGSGVTWAADRRSRRTSAEDCGHVDITARHILPCGCSTTGLAPANIVQARRFYVHRHE
jgi:hypothetical protein